MQPEVNGNTSLSGYPRRGAFANVDKSSLALVSNSITVRVGAHVSGEDTVTKDDHHRLSCHAMVSSSIPQEPLPVAQSLVIRHRHVQSGLAV